MKILLSVGEMKIDSILKIKNSLYLHTQLCDGTALVTVILC